MSLNRYDGQGRPKGYPGVPADDAERTTEAAQRPPLRPPVQQPLPATLLPQPAERHPLPVEIRPLPSGPELVRQVLATPQLQAYALFLLGVVVCMVLVMAMLDTGDGYFVFVPLTGLALLSRSIVVASLFVVATLWFYVFPDGLPGPLNDPIVRQGEGPWSVPLLVLTTLAAVYILGQWRWVALTATVLKGATASPGEQVRRPAATVTDGELSALMISGVVWTLVAGIGWWLLQIVVVVPGGSQPYWIDRSTGATVLSDWQSRLIVFIFVATVGWVVIRAWLRLRSWRRWPAASAAMYLQDQTWEELYREWRRLEDQRGRWTQRRTSPPRSDGGSP